MVARCFASRIQARTAADGEQPVRAESESRAACQCGDAHPRVAEGHSIARVDLSFVVERTRSVRQRVQLLNDAFCEARAEVTIQRVDHR